MKYLVTLVDKHFDKPRSQETRTKVKQRIYELLLDEFGDSLVMVSYVDRRKDETGQSR